MTVTSPGDDDDDDITGMLRDLGANKSEAESKLFAAIYPALRRIAAHYLSGERAGHTLQPSALVNEAFVQLRPQLGKQWQDRKHFLAVAAQILRRALVDYARRRNTQKRLGGQRRIEFTEGLLSSEDRLDDILRIDQALERLAQWDERQSRIVEMRFFGGLTEDEVGEALGIAPRTVKRDWRLAKAWLYGELNGGSPATGSTA